MISRKVLYPCHERLRGRCTMEVYESLLRSDREGERVEVEQTQKLRSLLEHCRDNVPAYKVALSGYDLSTLRADPTAVLATLPVLERGHLQDAGSTFEAEPAPLRTMVSSTGGSTGHPLRFKTDPVKEACHNAQKFRFRRWFNVKPGDRQVDLWGSPIELSTQSYIRQWKDKYLLNHVILSAHDLTPDRISDYCNFLAKYKPRLIYGYPSVMARLAFAVEEGRGDIGDCRPAVMICTSEMLLDQDRERIGRVFQCLVVNEYGSRDGGLTAHECAYGGFHLAAEHVLVEVTDTDDDGFGDLLVTNLDGYGMPFLRYRIGDRGRLGSGHCVCGSRLPLLDRLQGRTTAFVCGAGDRHIHGSAINYVFREIPGIVQYKVVQRNDYSLDVWLIPGADWSDDSKESIWLGMRITLGLEVDIRIHEVNEIPRSLSGKHKWVECEVPPSAGRDGVMQL